MSRDDYAIFGLGAFVGCCVMSITGSVINDNHVKKLRENSKAITAKLFSQPK